jgi:hypothetical protein
MEVLTRSTEGTILCLGVKAVNSQILTSCLSFAIICYQMAVRRQNGFYGLVKP